MAAENGIRVLIAVDGSGFADVAFNWYLEFLHRQGNKIFLCHVREHIVQHSFGFRVGLAISAEQWNSAMKEMDKAEQDIMAQYTSVLQHKKIPYEIVPAFGDAGLNICQQAKKRHISLIVMGTRGQGAVRRTVLGSVSDYVLHESDCNVAICHKPATKDATVTSL